MNELPKTRLEAKELGSVRYNTGKPCKYGHCSDRYVKKSACVECKNERWRKAHARKTQDPDYVERRRVRRAAYWKKNNEVNRYPKRDT